MLTLCSWRFFEQGESSPIPRVVTEAVARKRLHVKDFKYPYKDSKALAQIASIPTSNLTSICVVGSARSDHTIAQLQKLLVPSKNLESLTIRMDDQYVFRPIFGRLTAVKRLEQVVWQFTVWNYTRANLRLVQSRASHQRLHPPFPLFIQSWGLQSPENTRCSVFDSFNECFWFRTHWTY